MIDVLEGGELLIHENNEELKIQNRDNYGRLCLQAMRGIGI